MISQNTIQIVKKKLIETYNPRAIYVFGSYAWGNPTNDSDLDLLIVVEKLTSNRHNMIVKGYSALFNCSLSKDIL